VSISRRPSVITLFDFDPQLVVSVRQCGKKIHGLAMRGTCGLFPESTNASLLLDKVSLHCKLRACSIPFGRGDASLSNINQRNRLFLSAFDCRTASNIWRVGGRHIVQGEMTFDRVWIRKNSGALP
jgi:hypothetical protein